MITGILFGLIAYYQYQFIKKYEVSLYIITIIFTSILMTLQVTDIIAEFAMGFFMVVMFAGVLSPKNKLGKALRSIRKHYSIIGTIFGLAHGLHYILENDIEIFGLIAIIISIPLMITSFFVIRKKMTNKQWKTLHKLSYAVYVTLILHMIFVGAMQYVIIFIIYLALKLRYELSFKNNLKLRKN